MNNRTVWSILVLLLVSVFAVNLIAAQDSTPEPTATRPYIGVRVVPDPAGVRVVDLVTGSPAEAAGLRRGDVIVALGGQPVTVVALTEAVEAATIGDTLALTIQRGNETLDVTVTLTELPLQPELGQRPYFGLSLVNADGGALVRRVEAESPAAQAGLQVGDLITAIDGTPVTSARDAVAALRSSPLDQAVTLTITRAGAEQDISVTPVAAPLRPIIRAEVGGLIFDGTNWQVGELAEDSELYTAGLRTGDVITAVNGETLDPRLLMQLLMQSDASDPLTLTVQREGAEQTIETTVGALQSLLQMPGRMGPGMMSPQGFLGVEAINLDETVAQERGVEQTQGAYVAAVLPESPAAQIGLEEGDVITAVNGEPITSDSTLQDYLSGFAGGDTVTLTVKRGGETLELSVTLDTSPFGPRGFGPRGNCRGGDCPGDGGPHGGPNGDNPDRPGNPDGQGSDI